MQSIAVVIDFYLAYETRLETNENLILLKITFI